MTNARCFKYITPMVIAVHISAGMIAAVGVDRLLALKMPMQ